MTSPSRIFNAHTHAALFSHLKRITTDVDQGDVVLLGDHGDIATRYISDEQPFGFIVDMEQAGVNLKRCHFLNDLQREVPVPAQPERTVMLQEYDSETEELIKTPHTIAATPATTRTYPMPASLDSETVKDHLVKMILYPKSDLEEGEEPLRIRTIVVVDQCEHRYLKDFLRDTVKANVQVIFATMIVPGFQEQYCPCGGPPEDSDWETDLIPVNLEEPAVAEFAAEWGDQSIEERSEWLFDEFIPLTEPTGFTGEADTRKSTLALTIAAQGSIAAPWFTGTPNLLPAFSTAYAGTEDSWSSVSLPRYLAAGGDRRRICRLPLEVKIRKRDDSGKPIELSTPFTLDVFLGQLEKFIHHTNLSDRGPLKLLIFDPLISFFGSKDYNSPQDATELMQKIKQLQEDTRCAVLNLMHHNKTAGQAAKQRTSGSHRISDAHKMLWTFTLDEDDKQITLITPTKKNLLHEAIGHKITTESVDLVMPDGRPCKYGKVRYLGTTTKSTDQILQEKESPERGKQKDVCAAILEALAAGPVKAGKVTYDLRDMASLSTIKRCAARLLEEGKLLKTSPSKNPNDITWELAKDTQRPLPSAPEGEF